MERLPGDSYLDQELMASMLGVRREGITEAAGNLAKRGAINIAGPITVVDRRMLEKLRCE